MSLNTNVKSLRMSWQWSCNGCGKPGKPSDPEYSCDCGGLIDISYDWKGADADRLKALFDERLSCRLGPYASGVWRYKELILPHMEECWITTKAEGNTGMYTHDTLTEYAGCRKLWLKALSENPSGSFKDHGMTAAVSYGRSIGYSRFVCSSTGNTSASLAMYAALAGCSSYVLLPSRGVSFNKMLQTSAYGAEVLTFDGTYDDGIRFCQSHAEELGMYVCNSVNPIRIEGQKSIIFEIAHTFGWQLPDWIVVPGGALSNATALGKGLREMHELGLIDKLPRVAVVQAEGASPFHRMVASGSEIMNPESHPATRASALNIGDPPSWRKALHYTIGPCRGVTVSVSDAEIMEAKAKVDRSGIGCEPASAASVAGLRKLRQQQIIDKDEAALCLLTGHILKDTDALDEYLYKGSFGANLTNPPMEWDLSVDGLHRRFAANKLLSSTRFITIEKSMKKDAETEARDAK